MIMLVNERSDAVRRVMRGQKTGNGGGGRLFAVKRTTSTLRQSAAQLIYRKKQYIPFPL